VLDLKASGGGFALRLRGFTGVDHFKLPPIQQVPVKPNTSANRVAALIR
jgi:hypothetical protein